MLQHPAGAQRRVQECFSLDEYPTRVHADQELCSAWLHNQRGFVRFAGSTLQCTMWQISESTLARRARAGQNFPTLWCGPSSRV